MQVIIVENVADPSSWETHETTDILELLKSKWSIFPETARIYHGLISSDNDVTPGDQEGVDKLKELSGPFYVVLYPAGFVVIIAVILAVAAVAFLPTAAATQANLPTPAVARNQQTASPNNELSDRTNSVRINGRIPDIFGKVRSTPDLIAAPYKIFEAGREVEYAYMCVGRGYYTIEDVRDGATLCANIPGVSINVYDPFTSPNSGDAPMLNIGGLINSRVLAVRRSNSVNGQVLRPPNSASIVGNRNIAFRYPGTIQYTVVPGSDANTPAFSSQFAEGDLLTITDAVQTAVNNFLVGALVTVVGKGTPYVTIVGLPSSFWNGGFMHFAYPPGAPTTPPLGLTVGASITLTQHIDPAVGDYHVSTPGDGVVAPAEIVGSGANISGTYTIAEISTYVNPYGGVVFTVLLSNPGAVNANWNSLNYNITIYGAGPANNRLDISIGGIATLPAFNLDGSYTVLGVTEDTIVLNNPAGTNSDWNILDTIAGDTSPPLSPTLAASGRRWIGPFILDSSEATSVFCNFVASNGMYKDDGTTQVASTVDIMIEITPVDDTDTPNGPSETSTILMTGSETLKETVAFTLKASFSSFSGRCQIRATRLTETDTAFDGQVVDEVRWRDVYAVTPVTLEHFGNVTTVHAKTFATSSALAVKERKLTMLATRKLPARVGTTAEFTDDALVATINAADIFVAICRDLYIGNRPIEEIDVDNIYDTVADIATYFDSSLATEFSYTFDNDNLSFEETAALVAQSLHSIAYRRGNVIRLSFEKKTADSTLLFNHRNKIPRSELREFTFGFANNNDGIEYSYVDPKDDSIITIFLPTDQSAINPKKIESIGVRNHLQAYFLAWRAWNKIRFQKVGVKFDATQEADLLLRNDRILVTDGTRQGTQDGEVIAVSSLQLTLSQNVDLTGFASYVIFLQHKDGTVESIACTAGTNANQVVLATAPSQALVTDPESYARTTYMLIGNTETRQTAFLVVEKEPLDKMTSTVTAINYDDRYYQNDKDKHDGVITGGGYGGGTTSGGGGGGYTPPPVTPPYTPPPAPTETYVEKTITIANLDPPLKGYWPALGGGSISPSATLETETIARVVLFASGQLGIRFASATYTMPSDITYVDWEKSDGSFERVGANGDLHSGGYYYYLINAWDTVSAGNTRRIRFVTVP